MDHYEIIDFEAIKNSSARRPLFFFDNTYDYLFNPRYQKFKKGLEIWIKYKHFFPSKNIAICYGKVSYPSPYTSVMVINKPVLRNTLVTYHDEFAKTLGYSFHPEDLTEKILSNPGLLEKHLKGNHYLCGIIYGFGNNNAKQFQARSEPYEYQTPPYQVKYQSEKPQNKELKPFLSKKISPKKMKEYQLYIPGFVVDRSTEETRKLEEAYTTLFHRLGNEKKHVDNLEWCLIQLLKN